MAEVANFVPSPMPEGGLYVLIAGGDSSFYLSE